MCFRKALSAQIDESGRSRFAHSIERTAKTSFARSAEKDLTFKRTIKNCKCLASKFFQLRTQHAQKRNFLLSLSDFTALASQIGSTGT